MDSRAPIPLQTEEVWSKGSPKTMHCKQAELETARLWVCGGLEECLGLSEGVP